MLEMFSKIKKKFMNKQYKNYEIIMTYEDMWSWYEMFDCVRNSTWER